MPAMTYGQIYNVYKAASGSRDSKHLDIMTAIALAESSGNPSVINSIGATGLWQILWSVWSKDNQMVSLTRGNRSALLDPNVNAEAAHIVYKKQGYGAWVVYTTGAYTQHLKNGNVSVGEKLGVPTVEQATSIVTDPATAIWGKAQGFITQGSKVIGVSVLGVLLLLIGVVVIILSSRAGKTVVGAASGIGAANAAREANATRQATAQAKLEIAQAQARKAAAS